MKVFSLLLLGLLATPIHSSYCPTSFHSINGVYDPIGPILIDDTWHVFPDTFENHWAHFTSKDLLHWEKQTEIPDPLLANGDTGSISVTPGGLFAHYPNLQAPFGINLQTPTDTTPTDLNNWSNSTSTFADPKSIGLGIGFRDPHRAIKLPDDNWYMGVGTGYGGTNPETQLPTSGTGCLAWMRATDESLSELTFQGCLLENNVTSGHINPGTLEYVEESEDVAFFECPDVFPLGDDKSFVAVASFYNWDSAKSLNEYFVGR